MMNNEKLTYDWQQQQGDPYQIHFCNNHHWLIETVWEWCCQLQNAN